MPKANCAQSGPAASSGSPSTLTVAGGWLPAESPLRVSGWHVLEAYEPRRWSVVAHSHLGILSISTCARI